MALALSFGLDQGFRPYEKSGLALVWIAPLLARPGASTLLLPIGLLAVLFFIAGLVRRARTETALSTSNPAEASAKKP